MLDVTGRHPAVQHFAHHFDHDHLPPHLAAVSAPFHEMAQHVIDQLPDNPELSSALRSLWDAKNSTVFVAAKNPDALADGRTPRIGMTVDYTLSEQDADHINRRRAHALERARLDGHNYPVHVGNSAAAGDVRPMVITHVWSDKPEPHHAVNGQVQLDGNDLHWVTSVQQGEGERQWR
jgi:hypothetical protein